MRFVLLSLLLLGTLAASVSAAATSSSSNSDSTDSTPPHTHLPHGKKAGVSPIDHDPIPSWASEKDICLQSRSCDDCNIEQNAGSAYCKYTEQGVPQCCASRELAQDIQQKHAAIASSSPAAPIAALSYARPVAVDPIPSWASSNDVCAKTVSCDECKRSQYCKYNHKGKPSCCSAPDAHSHQDTDLLHSELGLAEILPVAKNPSPMWASTSDHCVRTTSCDNCSEKQYCKYTRIGIPKCCSAPSNIPINAPVKITRHAGTAPIDKDPIPSWASAADVCVTHRSCDLCSPEQYCKYLSVGKSVSAQCCSAATDEHKLDHLDYVLAKTSPVVKDPTPAWANPNSDLCVPKKSCDDCHVSSNEEYCHYSSTGQPSCCGRADRIIAGSNAPADVIASSNPSEEPYLPKWARKDDRCAKNIRSCDECEASETQYCKYTAKGNPRCCVAFDNPNAPVLTRLVSKSAPPTESGIPVWADKSDECSVISSCDLCRPTDDQYCKYGLHEKGKAYCCHPSADAPEHKVTARSQPIEHEEQPKWGSAKDVCKFIRTCDDCYSDDHQYCKYTETGKPQCCEKASDKPKKKLANKKKVAAPAGNKKMKKLQSKLQRRQQNEGIDEELP